MKWESIVSILISIGAAIGALYTYFVHTRKLNEQQKQINEQLSLLNKYQIDKNKEEEDNKKKALIEANTFSTYNGKYKSWRIKIYNKGSAKALNIRLVSPDIDNDDMVDLRVPNGFLPYPSLVPQQSFEIGVVLSCNHKDFHRIRLIWDDESGKDRFQEQDISF